LNHLLRRHVAACTTRKHGCNPSIATLLNTTAVAERLTLRIDVPSG
jgi:hypothetical protein